MTLKNAKGRLKTLKERLNDALKRYRTGINLRMLRVAEGTQGGRKGDGVRKNGDGTVTVTAQKR